ncbi:60S ribosomal protein L35a-1 [Gossypium australe]|uniref:60S ribosomal protein L35a-1 n=1 Tax=Gossypium australe TaxID=47621 RepID=A0A5B6V6V0_9ROSI|nr:60S ribosomal protein L35a-1 [Gossypium australe]
MPHWNGYSKGPNITRPTKNHTINYSFSLFTRVFVLSQVKRQQRCHLRFTMVKGRQGERVRLYVRGTILGYKRSKSNQYPNTSLIQIEGVNTKEEVGWYCGKRMAYIYKAKVKKNGSHYRCIWGKVTRPHGNSGVVRAKFKSNLPPKSMGDKVRVFMYPSNI